MSAQTPTQLQSLSVGFSSGSGVGLGGRSQGHLLLSVAQGGEKSRQQRAKAQHHLCLWDGILSPFLLLCQVHLPRREQMGQGR